MTTARRRFESSASTEALGGDHDSPEPAPGRARPLRKAIVIPSALMAIAAIACFVAAGAVTASKGPATVSDADAEEIFDLRSRIQLAEATQEALPNAADSERALVTAHDAAISVASLQNDYRILTPSVRSGSLPQDAAFGTRQALGPYFAPDVDPAILDPWYLLASDAEVPLATGLPMTFRSGFTWSAQSPYSIDEEGRVKVTWLATETSPAEGAPPRVLAWAQADYEMTRKVFMNVRVGTTTTGAAEQMMASG